MAIGAILGGLAIGGTALTAYDFARELAGTDDEDFLSGDQYAQVREGLAQVTPVNTANQQLEEGIRTLLLEDMQQSETELELRAELSSLTQGHQAQLRQMAMQAKPDPLTTYQQYMGMINRGV